MHYGLNHQSSHFVQGVFSRGAPWCGTIASTFNALRPQCGLKSLRLLPRRIYYPVKLRHWLLSSCD